MLCVPLPSDQSVTALNLPNAACLKYLQFARRQKAFCRTLLITPYWPDHASTDYPKCCILGNARKNSRPNPCPIFRANHCYINLGPIHYFLKLWAAATGQHALFKPHPQTPLAFVSGRRENVAALRFISAPNFWRKSDEDPYITSSHNL
jgi:hypothetical protein